MGIDKDAFKAFVESDGSIPFDLFAQDVSEWAWLDEFIPGVVVSSAGGMFPFQAEGLIHGYPFYYRHEWGSASLRVGEIDGETPYLDSLWSSRVDYDDKIGEENFPKLLIQLVSLLEKSQFLYKFKGRRIDFLNDGSWSFTVSDEFEKHDRGAWGHNAVEAFMELRKPNEYLIEHGCSAEQQDAIWVAHDYDPIPTNRDERKFPEFNPSFIRS
jgi:hypothetical protein